MRDFSKTTLNKKFHDFMNALLWNDWRILLNIFMNSAFTMGAQYIKFQYTVHWTVDLHFKKNEIYSGTSKLLHPYLPVQFTKVALEQMWLCHIIYQFFLPWFSFFSSSLFTVQQIVQISFVQHFCQTVGGDWLFHTSHYCTLHKGQSF